MTSSDISIEVIGVAQLEETNDEGQWGRLAQREKKNERLSWAMPHSDLKLKKKIAPPQKKEKDVLISPLP